MIGNISKSGNSMMGGGVDFSKYFNNLSTNTFSESQFINILNDAVFYEGLKGAYVNLSNTYAYNNGLYRIIDVNHDPNYPNTYDLMSVNGAFDSTYKYNSDTISVPLLYRNSLIRNTLNTSFYNGFVPDLKKYMINMRYNCEGTWYNDDKIIIPSVSECYPPGTYIGELEYFDRPTNREPGIQYDLINPSSLNINGSSIWLRTPVTYTNGDTYYYYNNSGSAYCISGGGNLNYNYTYNSYRPYPEYVYPIFRIQV